MMIGVGRGREGSDLGSMVFRVSYIVYIQYTSTSLVHSSAVIVTRSSPASASFAATRRRSRGAPGQTAIAAHAAASAATGTACAGDHPPRVQRGFQSDVVREDRVLRGARAVAVDRVRDGSNATARVGGGDRSAGSASFAGGRLRGGRAGTGSFSTLRRARRGGVRGMGGGVVDELEVHGRGVRGGVARALTAAWTASRVEVEEGVLARGTADGDRLPAQGRVRAQLGGRRRPRRERGAPARGAPARVSAPRGTRERTRRHREPRSRRRARADCVSERPRLVVM